MKQYQVWLCGIGIGTTSLLAPQPVSAQVEVPVEIFFGSPSDSNSRSFFSGGDSVPALSGTGFSVPALAIASSNAAATAFNSAVCGGVGNPVKAALEEIDELSASLAVSTSSTEQRELSQAIYEKARVFGVEVIRDFSERGVKATDSEACDSLVRAVRELQEQVLDYAKALQNSQTSVYW